MLSSCALSMCRPLVVTFIPIIPTAAFRSFTGTGSPKKAGIYRTPSVSWTEEAISAHFSGLSAKPANYSG